DCTKACLEAKSVEECARQCVHSSSNKLLDRRGNSHCCEKYRGWGFSNENRIVEVCYNLFSQKDKEPCKGYTCVKPCGLNKGCYGKCAAAAFS
ncbi:59_t:CDS:1, partial [Racocetra persica]